VWGFFMKKTTIVVAVLLSIILSGICHAKESPYRLRDRDWPGEVGHGVYCLADDLSSQVDMFMHGEQLYKDGQPVSSLEKPLGTIDAWKMFYAQWKEETGEALFLVSNRKYKPMKLHDWLLELIKESSLDEATKLQHVRTLGAMFEVRSDSELANWQGFRMTAYTILGKIRDYVMINTANGHSFTMVTFPDLPFKSPEHREKMRAKLRQLRGK